MIRKILHSGTMMQVLLLSVILAGAYIIYVPDSHKAAAGQSLVLAKTIVNTEDPAQVNYYDTLSSYPEPPFLPVNNGAGGPLLLVTDDDNPFSIYTAEILRAEGIGYFETMDISLLGSARLDSYDMIVLGETDISGADAVILENFVHAGGTLIAFKPSATLSSLMGITPAYGTLRDKYLLVNTSTAAGSGITGETMQFHGMANLYALDGATSLATLYSSAVKPTINPAITIRQAGSRGGMAIAYAYDLPRSVVYTRQGNPRWAGQKRDGQINPIRSDDMFYPDWIDLEKVAIPQADEQQRLFVNIILHANIHRKPLPRFWYLPRDLKAAIVMTGDDHAMNETADRFRQYLSLGPNNETDVSDWNAIRATSYIYPDTRLTNEEAVVFEKQGFEIALHPNTNCSNYTPRSLNSAFSVQLAQLKSRLPGLASPVTNRTHCLTWSDWATTPKTELQHGIRMDASYYYWPASWIANRPGMFTGSGFPMRFADMDGTLIDNYQLVTQMTDESGIDVNNFCIQLLDKALGPEGYYGTFCANMHTDIGDHKGSDSIISVALARNVPVISAKQLLTWIDARTNSYFRDIVWNNHQLHFAIFARRDARHLRVMLQEQAGALELQTIRSGDQVLPYRVETIKGIRYVFFTAIPGQHTYTATYHTPGHPVTTGSLSPGEKLDMPAAGSRPVSSPKMHHLRVH